MNNAIKCAVAEVYVREVTATNARLTSENERLVSENKRLKDGALYLSQMVEIIDFFANKLKKIDLDETDQKRLKKAKALLSLSNTENSDA